MDSASPVSTFTGSVIPISETEEYGLVSTAIELEPPLRRPHRRETTEKIVSIRRSGWSTAIAACVAEFRLRFVRIFSHI